MNNQNNDFDDDENITFAPVTANTAIGLACPFISGNGNVVNCSAENCMAWHWTNSVNYDMGVCLML